MKKEWFFIMDIDNFTIVFQRSRLLCAGTITDKGMDDGKKVKVPTLDKVSVP